LLFSRSRVFARRALVVPTASGPPPSGKPDGIPPRGEIEWVSGLQPDGVPPGGEFLFQGVVPTRDGRTRPCLRSAGRAAPGRHLHLGARAHGCPGVRPHYPPPSGKPDGIPPRGELRRCSVWEGPVRWLPPSEHHGLLAPRRRITARFASSSLIFSAPGSSVRHSTSWRNGGRAT